jgi:hypothetical protein
LDADPDANDTAIQEAVVATVNDLAVTDDEGDANIDALTTLTQQWASPLERGQR